MTPYQRLYCWRLFRLVCRVRLFFKIVWRRDYGSPIDIRTAWAVATLIHPTRWAPPSWICGCKDARP